ncbi:hypothetical protein AB4166_18025 [Vibrio splendidus]|jgi:hypothetical protein|uniref:hypothetical protein n=1 Tax=Vibrio splendidus TaxID=29497 RepID=UPI000C82E91B|nr:hypothetical protein [Vibrio splendidus]PMO47922.1 hypothetical protein BCT09_02545 [Vibrio splendidus]
MDKLQVVEIVKEIFNYQLVGPWIYLALFFVTAIGSFIGAWIKKNAEIKALNGNFKTVLKQQEELVNKTEKIRKELEKGNIKYQIKLADYNEKSLNAIEQVYSKLIQIRKASKELGYDQNIDNVRSFYDAIDDFSLTFDVKRIWIPIELAREIEQVAIKIDKKVALFNGATNTSKRAITLTEEQLKKVFDIQDEFYNFMGTELSHVFDNLVEKINTETTS